MHQCPGSYPECVYIPQTLYPQAAHCRAKLTPTACLALKLFLVQGTASVWEGREREIHSRPLKHCEEREKNSSSSSMLKELREPYQVLGTQWDTHLEESMADAPKPKL